MLLQIEMREWYRNDLELAYTLTGIDFLQKNS